MLYTAAELRAHFLDAHKNNDFVLHVNSCLDVMRSNAINGTFTGAEFSFDNKFIDDNRSVVDHVIKTLRADGFTVSVNPSVYRVYYELSF